MGPPSRVFKNLKSFLGSELYSVSLWVAFCMEASICSFLNYNISMLLLKMNQTSLRIHSSSSIKQSSYPPISSHSIFHVIILFIFIIVVRLSVFIKILCVILHRVPLQTVFIKMVYQFPGAAVTKYHRPGGLKQQTWIFSQSSGSQRSKPECWQC